MSIERRLEKLEQKLLPMKPWVTAYAPGEGMSADEEDEFIAAELAARGEPEDANIIFVTFVSVSVRGDGTGRSPQTASRPSATPTCRGSAATDCSLCRERCDGLTV